MSQFNDSQNLDFNQKVSEIHEKLYVIYNQCCPIRCKILSHNKIMKPYVSDAIVISINRKHELARQARDGLVGRGVYTQFRNALTRTLRIAKTVYYCNKFESCRGDIRKTWKNLNYFLRSSKARDNPVEIIQDGRTVNDPKLLPSLFNTYFSEIGEVLERDIPASQASPIDLMGDRNPASCFPYPSTADEVSNIIKSFPVKGCSLESVPIFIFKYLSAELSTLISAIFNQSLSLGIFPDCLKVARVIPVYKGGNKLLVNNYRPISTLPLLSKILEKLMCSRLKSFLNSFKILTDHQFGFRTGTSTSDAVLQFTDFCYDSLNRKQVLAAVFLDFAKAFDTVQHDVLLQKLNHIGVRGVVNSWFASYLHNRSQHVSLANYNSSCLKIKTGVPQGSVLGPLLFFGVYKRYVSIIN